MTFDLSKLTDKDVDGAGIFDVLMSSVSAHLKNELDEDRITQTMYGQIYSAGLVQTLSIASQLFTTKDTVELQNNLITQQIETELAKTQNNLSNGNPVEGIIGKDVEVKEAQKELYLEQKDAYGKDQKIKGTKLLIDTWTLQKSLDANLLVPSNFTNAEIDLTVDNLKTELDI